MADDPFLLRFDANDRPRIIGAFIQAYQHIRVQPDSSKRSPNVSSTCRAAFDAVASAFRLHGFPSPAHEPTGALAICLQRQLRSFSSTDPNPAPQKALPSSMLRFLAPCAITPANNALCPLLIGAFFFAMRSCEYTHTSGTRRTKVITLQNIRFFRNKTEIGHKDNYLHLADSVSITFVFQKNDQRNTKVTQHRTDDCLLCPVISWASVVKRVMQIIKATQSTTVNTYRIDDAILQLTAAQSLALLRRAAEAMGHQRLGFHPSEIGTHSIRSGAAMAMYLAGVPVYTIKLQGRWSSDAFLRYIRRQVQDFSIGVASKMTASPDFFTVPDYTTPSSQSHTRHYIKNFMAFPLRAATPDHLKSP